jgi:hypothetical protein
MIAPRPFLISATEDDKWSAGASEIYEAARSAFPQGMLQLALYPGGHSFSHDMRKRAYAFLDSHLTDV